MAGQIELLAFMGLRTVFRDRGWSIPHVMDLPHDMSGEALLQLLAIDRAKVESLIVNRSAVAIEDAVIHPGDRVALVPPGVPGPHRLLLGIHAKSKPAQPFGLAYDGEGDGRDGGNKT